MNNFFKILLFLAFLLATNSCQLNKLALGPWKNPVEKKDFYLKEGQDSIHLKCFGENLQPVFYRNNKIFERDFSIKSFYFTTNEGRKINAWLLKSNSGKPKASVFALHGNAANLNVQYRNFSNLTQYGYQVFIFDYAGFGYSEGKATRKNALQDSFSAFEFFENLDKVKNTPKIIYGQSIGGNFAIPVAVQNQDGIEGLVLEGTFMNFKNIPNYYVPFLGGLIIANNYNNKQNLKSFKKPMLVIHSTEDRVVPFKLGKKIFENANEPKAFLEIDKAHINGIKFYADKISAKIDSLILKN